MELDLTTPALLFPTISLLLLAYTNRFNTLATIIRNLHSKYQTERNENLLAQIGNLRYRVYLIRNMQIVGVPACRFAWSACLRSLRAGRWLDNGVLPSRWC